MDDDAQRLGEGGLVVGDFGGERVQEVYGVIKVGLKGAV